jgi:hypothetical protein
MAGRLLALNTYRALFRRNITCSASGTYFCSRSTKPQGLVPLEGLDKLIKIIQVIYSRPRALPAMLLRAPSWRLCPWTCWLRWSDHPSASTYETAFALRTGIIDWVVQPLGSFPAVYGTWGLFTASTRALQLYLSWARPVQPNPITERSILMLSIHLRLRETWSGWF